MLRLIKNIKGKKTLVGGIICSALLFNISYANGLTFNDIDLSSDYAREAIISLAEKNIISGNEQGKFNPHKTVNRAEMIKIIVSALEIDTSNLPETPTFEDVNKDHWAFEFVEAAYREGIIKGVGLGVFGANSECTREEMITMFMRSFSLKDGDMEGKISHNNINKLHDKDLISDWAKDYVEIAISSNLIKGNSSTTFGAKENAKREQVAVVTDRFINSKSTVYETIDNITDNNEHHELYTALENRLLNFKGRVDLTINSRVTNTLSTQISATNINGIINRQDYKLDMNMNFLDSNGQSQNINTKTILLNDKYYTRNPIFDKWIVRTTEELKSEGINISNPVLNKEKHKELLNLYNTFNIEKKQVVEINGEECIEYEISLNKEAERILFSNYNSINNAEKIESMDKLLKEGYTAKLTMFVNDKKQIIREEFSINGTTLNDEELDLNIKGNYYDMGKDLEIKEPKITNHPFSDNIDPKTDYSIQVRDDVLEGEEVIEDKILSAKAKSFIGKPWDNLEVYEIGSGFDTVYFGDYTIFAGGKDKTSKSYYKFEITNRGGHIFKAYYYTEVLPEHSNDQTNSVEIMTKEEAIRYGKELIKRWGEEDLELFEYEGIQNNNYGRMVFIPIKNEIPLLNCKVEIIMDLNKGRLQYFNASEYFINIQREINLEPKITPKEAIDIAKTIGPVEGTPKLKVIGGKYYYHEYVLVYGIPLLDKGKTIATIYIDAISGNLVRIIPLA